MGPRLPTRGAMRGHAWPCVAMRGHPWEIKELLFRTQKAKQNSPVATRGAPHAWPCVAPCVAMHGAMHGATRGREESHGRPCMSIHHTRPTHAKRTRHGHSYHLIAKPQPKPTSRITPPVAMRQTSKTLQNHGRPCMAMRGHDAEQLLFQSCCFFC